MCIFGTALAIQMAELEVVKNWNSRSNASKGIVVAVDDNEKICS